MRTQQRCIFPRAQNTVNMLCSRSVISSESSRALHTNSIYILFGVIKHYEYLPFSYCSLGTQMWYIQFIVICVILECITICSINIQFQRITAQKMLNLNKPVHIQNLNLFSTFDMDMKLVVFSPYINPQELKDNTATSLNPLKSFECLEHKHSSLGSVYDSVYSKHSRHTSYKQ